MTYRLVLEAISFHRRTFAIAFAALAVVLCAVAWIVGTEYKAESSVLMVADVPSTSETADKPILSGDLPYLATTPAVLDRLAHDLGEPVDADTLDRLKHHIKASLTLPPGPAGVLPGGVLVLRFTAWSQSEAVGGANDLARDVTAYYRDRATLRYRLLVSDLQRQVADRRRSVSAIDRQLAAIGSQYPLIAVRDGGPTLSETYGQLYQRRIDAIAAASSDSASAAVVAQRPAQTAAAAWRGLEDGDPVFTTLRDQYAHENARLAATRALYTPRYPGLPELENTVTNERRSVEDMRTKITRTPPMESLAYVGALGDLNRAQSATAGDAAKVASLSGALTTTRAELQSDQAETTRFEDLQRVRGAEAAAFTTLWERLAEAQAREAEAGSVGSVNVLDDAVYSKPVIYTHPLARFTVAILLSLALAAAIAFIKEARGRRLRTAEIIERIYSMPVIASVH